MRVNPAAYDRESIRPQRVRRPPQYVMIAFDNCTEVDRWDDWSRFLKRIKKKARVTFFVSGTNFLAEPNRQKYQGPRHQPGEAVIDFGSLQDLRDRIDYINALYNRGKQGNEFGSHAVGHFNANAEHWSAADWEQEFRAYNDLLDNVARNNGLAARLDYSSSDVRGFRAPYLEAGANLDTALKGYRYRYDTSLTGDADAWPVRDANGIWRFNLASIPVAGYPTTTLSMDYNFLVLQSGGEDDPDHSHWPRYGKEMFDAYMAYFKRNYEGNRAPLHIGHHFSEYQGGTYKRALMAFIEEVCTLPEVKCVTYSELRDFLEPLDAVTLAAYQRGDFPKRSHVPPRRPAKLSSFGPLVAVEFLKPPAAQTLKASLVGADRTHFKSGKFEWLRLGQRVGSGSKFDVSVLPRGETVALEIVFRDSDDKVRWRNRVSIVTGRRGAKLIPQVACCHGMKAVKARRTRETRAAF